MRHRRKTETEVLSTGKPVVAVFTKDHPCTKLDLWNAFRGRRGFVKVQVDKAKSIIGANAPRGMLSKERIILKHEDHKDVYELTETGKAWLETGIKRYLKNHPEDASKAVNLPKRLLH